MKPDCHYLHAPSDNPVIAIVQGIDRDVEHGEDLLMLGLGIVMLSSTFAPVAPPTVLLPLVALTFAITVCFAHRNYQRMERKLFASMTQLNSQELALLRPIAAVFSEAPAGSLAESFNPAKNLKRTLKSALGGVLINPLWMPIFYMMGIQIKAEKNLITLNQAIIGVERRILPPSTRA
ncbi:hypothetical protein [Methylomicrobium lacus]|uniref:hypothetical protein n=1 Tax=Methylomicrobium lacus TaxID=136992 RepID=UPI0035A9A33F